MSLAPTRYRFTVNSAGATFHIEAEDFEVDSDGVHFVDKAGQPEAFVHAFASHPCVVIQERPHGDA